MATADPDVAAGFLEKAADLQARSSGRRMPAPGRLM